MSTKENKAMVRRMYELYNRRELDAVYELYTPDCLFHFGGGDMPLEKYKQFDAMWYSAFPDTVSTIEDIIAEGDKVAFRVTHRGTHKGVYMGIAPTGNKIEVTNTVMGRGIGGKCVEGWVTADSLRLMQQIGAIPKR
jgi:predicted ester cyclase